MKQTKSDSFFSVPHILGMGGRQNTQQMKPKQMCENSKHALRSQQQQHAIQAHVLSDTELIGGMDMKLNEGKYNNLSDGRYETTIYVKTWTGRTVSLETDLNRAVETVKRHLEAKTGSPKDPQHLVSRGKVLTDDRTLKDCNISGGEAIEMTSLLLGGTKHKSLSTTLMDVNRDKKSKESEPYIDVGGLEEERPEPASEEEEVTAKNG